MQRLYSLDVLKLILALCIVALHIDWRIIPRGYLSVEFFFILSGFLIHNSKGYVKYNLFTLVRRVYPVYSASIVMILCFTHQEYDLRSVALSFFMLQSLGFNDVVINPPSWFLCVYIVSVPVLALVLRVLDRFENGSLFFSLLFPPIIYTMFFFSTPSGGFNYSFEYSVLGITVGLWRCWAAFFLGVLSSILSVRIESLNFNFSTCLEFFLFFYFIFIFFFSGWSPPYDYVSLPFIAASIIFTARGEGLLSHLFNDIGMKLRYSATLSTYLFLFHFPLIMVITESKSSDYNNLLLSVVYIISVICFLNYSGVFRKRV